MSGCWRRTWRVDVNAAVVDTAAGPVLRAEFAFPTGVLTAAEVGELARWWTTALTGLAQHVAAPGAGGLTPSDLPLVSLSQGEIEGLERRVPGLVEVWPLAPLQAGLLFHALLADRSVDAYLVQLVLELRGRVEPGRLRAAGQGLLDRHANLRAGVRGRTRRRVRAGRGGPGRAALDRGGPVRTGGGGAGGGAAADPGAATGRPGSTWPPRRCCG